MLAVVLAVAMPAWARKKPLYDISLKIEHNKDTVMYLGCYYGKGNQVLDTARVDSKGRFVFSSTEQALKPGLYFFANPQGTYVEFVVYGEKPFFTFETDESNWTANMKVKGSRQNDFFYQFQRADIAVSQDLDKNRVLMDSVAFKAYTHDALLRLDSVKQSCIDNHPEMFLSKMMLATQSVFTQLVDEKGDTLTDNQRRDYFMRHYFDNIPLDDEAVLRTPRAVFHDRTMAYFDSYLKYAMPEAIIEYMDPVLDRAKAAPEVFQWLLIKLTQKYLQSNVMVHDEVYVHLVKKYYASEDNFWSTPSSIDKELLRANKWERLLVGREAPELILFDTNHVPHSLHALPAKWKLLVFWSPSCGHCKHVIPAVYKVFDQYREQYGLMAFTILTEPDDKTRKLWKEFMVEHGMTSPAWLSLDGGEANVDWHDVYDITSTPQIYLLDENNVIQAKKIGESSIEQILNAVCKQSN